MPARFDPGCVPWQDYAKREDFARTNLFSHDWIVMDLRERLQTVVNRLMYGDRDDPYAVLTRLGQRLEAVGSVETALPTIIETIAQALKLP